MSRRRIVTERCSALVLLVAIWGVDTWWSGFVQSVQAEIALRERGVDQVSCPLPFRLESRVGDSAAKSPLATSLDEVGSGAGALSSARPPR